MPRPARFTDDDVLDATLRCVARLGHEVSIADVAAELDGPVGSIYHRFASREALLARLWMRSVRRFQNGILALSTDAPRDPGQAEDRLVAGALHIPRYCRRHPDEARALTLYRQQRLVDEGPAEVRDQAAHLNDAIGALIRQLTRLRFGTATAGRMQLTLLATRITPYGMVRPYLGGPVPRVVDDAVEASSRAILALGDRGAVARARHTSG